MTELLPKYIIIQCVAISDTITSTTCDMGKIIDYISFNCFGIDKAPFFITSHKINNVTFDLKYKYVGIVSFLFNHLYLFNFIIPQIVRYP